MEEFKFGQIVLVRGYDGEEWVAQHYSHCTPDDNDGYIHVVFGGDCYAQCKPYEGNEPLLGRTGNSIDQLDYFPRKKPKRKREHYEYLEHVEVKTGDGYWEPGVYLDYDPTVDDPANDLCHYVITDHDREPDWYRDCQIRKISKESNNE